jgi:rare lipoprotein A
VRGLRAGALLVLALAACTPAPKPQPRSMLGEPYSLGGLWSYPREDFALRESGVASVLPRRQAGLTANGEARDPDALVAAHRTLQLPAILSVTNLENGLTLKVRVNDRGPEQPGRILGLSPRAATLLGIPEGGTAQVRIAVDGEASRALFQSLPNPEARAPVIAAAPRGEVASEALAPLAGAREAAPRSVAVLPSARAATLVDSAPSPPPARLPKTVTRTPPQPGRLVVEAGRFHGPGPAQRRLASLSRLGARLQQEGRGRQASWRIMLGPFGTLAEADRAVAGVIAAGIPEVRLLVE